MHPEHPAHLSGGAVGERHAKDRDSDPGQQREHRGDAEQDAMRHLVAELAEDDKRADGDEHPLDDAEQALARRVDVAGGGIQVRHELAVRARREVPGQIHRDEEDDRLDVDGVLEGAPHHLAEADVLGRGGVLLGPILGLLQLALEIPGHERDDEQHEEDDARREQAVEGTVGARGQQRLAVSRKLGQRKRQD